MMNRIVHVVAKEPKIYHRIIVGIVGKNGERG
jgi:hypothetical protein